MSNLCLAELLAADYCVYRIKRPHIFDSGLELSLEYQLFGALELDLR